MTNPMSPEELRACRERAEAATPGELSVARGDEDNGSITYEVVRVGLTLAFVPEDTCGKWEHSSAKADAAFWASARADVLRLFATIDALQARTEKAEGKAGMSWPAGGLVLQPVAYRVCVDVGQRSQQQRA